MQEDMILMRIENQMPKRIETEVVEMIEIGMIVGTETGDPFFLNLNVLYFVF